MIARRKQRNVMVLALAGCICLGACCLWAQSNELPANEVNGAKARYVIGPGDEVSVRVTDSQDIPEKPIRVDPDGQIALPMIGRMEASRRSVEELERDITTRLKTYIIDPHVSVNVTDFASQPVSVLGAVGAPGVYQLSGIKTLAEIIALAKGLAPDAGGTIRITRYASGVADEHNGAAVDRNQARVQEIAVADLLSTRSNAASIPIQSKDVITVPKTGVVYVIGDVRKPGAQNLGNREQIGVLEAVSAAEGVLPTGSPQHAKLLHLDPKTSERTETALNVKRIMAGRAANPILQPGDVLLIPHNGPRAAEMRVIDAMISLGTGALVYTR
jgi:polysaccharide export outer membrane protein